MKFKSILLIIICSFFLSSCGLSKETSVVPIEKEPSQSEDTSNNELPQIIVSDNTAAKADTTISESAVDAYVLSEEEKNNPRLSVIEPSIPDKITLLFAGDINFDDSYSNMTAFRSRANGIYDTLSGELMEELQNADITMVNNEFPYSLRGTPTSGKRFTFRADPSRVEILNQMGVDIVSLANNHAYDHGVDALLDTFDTLDGAQIAYVGAGRNIQEAMKPYYYIIGNTKIAYVSATQIERNDPPDTKEATDDSPGVLRTLNPERFVSVIEEAKANSDFVVVYVHWGTENVYEIEQAQRDLAAAYEQAGAGLIIGDHPHCLQGIEYINQTPVIYSMGNFWFNSKNLDTGIVKATLNADGSLESFQFLPCLQHDCQTDLLISGKDSDYDRILGVMAGLSSNVSILSDGTVQSGSGPGVAAIAPRELKKPAYAVSGNTMQTISGSTSNVAE